MCPATLVGNWQAEIKKWLGVRLRPVACHERRQGGRGQRQGVRHVGPQVRQRAGRAPRANPYSSNNGHVGRWWCASCDATFNEKGGKAEVWGAGELKAAKEAWCEAAKK